MELDQAGDKVEEQYARYGPVKLEGNINGRRLDFRTTWLRNSQGWFDLSKDGKTLEGAAVADGTNFWHEWQGRCGVGVPSSLPARGRQDRRWFDREPAHVLLRAPKATRKGDAKRWPAVVILHGSNMNAKAYVPPSRRPGPTSRDHLILGINGEVPSDLGEEPRFNFSYVNFMGRSTYKGFPATNRESPGLISRGPG